MLRKCVLCDAELEEELFFCREYKNGRREYGKHCFDCCDYLGAMRLYNVYREAFGDTTLKDYTDLPFPIQKAWVAVYLQSI